MCHASRSSTSAPSALSSPYPIGWSKRPRKRSETLGAIALLSLPEYLPHLLADILPQRERFPALHLLKNPIRQFLLMSTHYTLPDDVEQFGSRFEVVGDQSG